MIHQSVGSRDHQMHWDTNRMGRGLRTAQITLIICYKIELDELSIYETLTCPPSLAVYRDFFDCRQRFLPLSHVFLPLSHEFRCILPIVRQPFLILNKRKYNVIRKGMLQG
jgi:hypothetical protein